MSAERNYKKEFERWLSALDEREALYVQLQEMQQKGDKEVEDAFYKELEFGTGGLRGVLGPGTNRMNIYTVARASQGIANYLNEREETPSIAIAYDTRINSRLFAETAAGVYIANGIKVFMYEMYSTVPQLSFAVRQFGCSMGAIVTASHNPSKYNGYKVYCNKGYQITGEQAADIQEAINKLDIFEDVNKLAFDRAKVSENFTFLKEDVVELFLDNVEKALPTIKDEKISKALSRLSVVYTPLNGAGNIPVRKMLQRMGIKNVNVVKEQELPDGNFPTCSYPNPEIREALELGCALCKEKKADILVATDPDCDRLGVAVQTENDFRLMTGNEIGLLMLQFLAEVAPREKGVAITTIASTKLIENICRQNSIQLVKLLTGFKYIGEYMTEMEIKGHASRFMLGFEESYGYLTGMHVRDKDGVNAVAMTCLMVAYYKVQGKSLVDALDELHEKYGYEMCKTLSFEFEGKEGAEHIQDLMKGFRQTPPLRLAGNSLLEMTDYKVDKVFSVDAEGTPSEKGSRGLPVTNAMEYKFDGGLELLIRPSGTEPKIKIYIFAQGKTDADAGALCQKTCDEVTALVGKA